MKKYTVIVVVPDDCPGEPLSLYFAAVVAGDLKKAIHAGRREAWYSRGKDRGAFKRWRCAYVLAGHPELVHIAGWTR